MTADVAGDLVLAQVLLDQLHRGKDGPFRAAGAEPGWADRHDLGQIRDIGGWRIRRARLIREKARCRVAQEGGDRVHHDAARVFARHREDVLAMQPRLAARAVEEGGDVLFDEFGLAFLDHQKRVLAAREVEHFGIHQRIGDVQAQDRDGAAAFDVGKAQPLQCADNAVVHAALHDQAHGGLVRAKNLVQTVVTDEVFCSRPAVLDLVDLLPVGHRRQNDARPVAAGVRQRVAHRQGRATVVFAGELAGDVAGPDAHHQHDRRVRRLGEREAVLHRLDDGRQVRPWVEQPELRLHREAVAAFLHDGGAFTVILAHDDERAAGHAR